ncbi:MAG TPA: hypothetical protein VK446_05490 [Methylocystis sp.]|nr:hypothetical protein [Methylocystis sp.]
MINEREHTAMATTGAGVGAILCGAIGVAALGFSALIPTAVLGALGGAAFGWFM